MDFTTKIEDASVSSDASSFKKVDWEKYKLIVQEILKKKFSDKNPSKSRVLLKRDRLNFACPYCGDSHKDDRKKRANIYLKSGRFKCYNSTECPSPALRNFLKDFDSLNDVSLDEISQLIELEKSYVPTKFNAGFSTQIVEDELISNYALTIEEVVVGLGLLPISPWLDNYLKKRLQKPSSRFWMDKQMNLWIFNTVNEDKVLGAQIRTFKQDATNKYLTYRLHKLYDLLDKEIPEGDEFQMLDEVSTFYGWFNVDIDKPIVVFEGPMDHFLLRNSIAQCSVSIQIDTNLGDFYFLYDNDSAGRTALIDKLNQGYSIFLWNKFIKHYNLPPKIKDFNDVMMVFKEKGKDYPTDIMNFFSQSKYDLYDL